MLQTVKQKRDEGFTIIEVLIVLAIAGLIMVVVFLAVPALQRNGRNNALKTDANNILSSVGEYVANNSGSVPAVTANFVAPSGGSVTVGGQSVKVGGSVSGVRIIEGQSAPANMTIGQIVVATGAKCDGNSLTTTGASPRSYAVYYNIETSGNPSAQCIGS